MKFLHKTFEAKKKEIIEVEIDTPTKVKFMTGRELKAYKMGKTYSYYGGRFEESPVRFVVPFDSMWNVVVEKGTYNAPLAVKASCTLTNPNSLVRSSVAVDAPDHVRQHALAANGEEDAQLMSLAARSEG
jgi:hypothetical protein